MQKPVLGIIVAIGKNRVLGKDNQLLWHIPDDLKRFKALTIGHPIIMGRKTFQSIVASLGHALPGRTNIVVTRDRVYQPSHQGEPLGDNIVIVSSIEEGVARAKELDKEEIFIGGGAEIYKQALPYVDKLYLTLIDDDKEGDSYFPEYEKYFAKKTFQEEHEWNGIKYMWVDLERK